jgi:hypothetical protein
MIAAMAGMAALQYYTSYEANEAANARAEAANANNAAAAEHSRLLAERDNKVRQEELLRRFNIRAGKVKDSVNDLQQSTALQLSNIDMEVLKATSITDNKLAAKHIEGRLADRFTNALALIGKLQEATAIQASQASAREVNEKLSAMVMDLESEQLNVNIDYSNAINQANNNEVRGITYSNSTGDLGSITVGLSGAMQGAQLTTAYNNYMISQSNLATAQTVSNIGLGV